jgi:lambda repressor-like predicted transcriptional regulator
MPRSDLLPTPPNLVADYLAGESPSELALRYGGSGTSISRMLREAGIRPRTKSEALVLAHKRRDWNPLPTPTSLIAEYISGESLAALSRRYSLSVGTVRSMLCKGGIPIRNYHEALALRVGSSVCSTPGCTKLRLRRRRLCAQCVYRSNEWGKVLITPMPLCPICNEHKYRRSGGRGVCSFCYRAQIKEPKGIVWDRASCIKAGEEWLDQNGGIPPTSTEWELRNIGPYRPSARLIAKRFGTWKAYLRLLGVIPWGNVRSKCPIEFLTSGELADLRNCECCGGVLASNRLDARFCALPDCQRKYRAQPEVRARTNERRRKYRQRRDVKEKEKEYSQRPEVRARARKLLTPEQKARKLKNTQARRLLLREYAP